MSDKKPRGDSKLDALPRDQQEQLASWLTVENLTYAKARERVKKEFGVATTASALSRFYSSFAVGWKYAQAKGDADTFAALMEGNFDEASIKRAKQLAFEAMTSQTPNLKAAKALLKIVGDSAKISLAERKLALDADKFRQLVKTEAEKGLDALQAELKNDAVALALFEQMRARVIQTLEAKAE